ncbi:MAG: cyclic nucleotide-binding domain-containing protein [Bdellovibrionales bacterium]|nr:cyclic nucleotide-binding domain-containing protein [Bdellovibrionales bacterium]
MVDPNFTQPSVQWLREIKLFAPFTNPELDALLKLGNARDFEAYSNVVVEGEFSWGLFLIAEGAVGVFKKNPSTEEIYDVGELAAGSYFGEMSLVDDQPRSATVRAKSRCRTFFISKEAFKHFLNESGDRKVRFYESCVKDLVMRLRELDGSYVVSQYQLWQTAVDRMRSRKESA